MTENDKSWRIAGQAIDWTTRLVFPPEIGAAEIGRRIREIEKFANELAALPAPVKEGS